MPSPHRHTLAASKVLALAAAAFLGAATARAEGAAPVPETTPVPEATPVPAPAATAAPAVAAEVTPPPVKPAPVEVTSFVDTYYGYYFNKPTGNVPLRNFDTKHNTFSLGLVEVAAEQKVTTANRLGFRLDLDAGPTAELVNAYEPGGLEFLKNIQQAYGSYLFGKKLQLDVGKFVTPAGAEVIETRDNWNYSRSLLFALAIPYYHAGLRATVPFNDKVSVTALLVNGWNDVVDNNSGKSWGLSATLKPTAKLSLVQTLMGGPEQQDDTRDKRFLSDTVVTLNATDKLSLMANYDYATDRVAGAGVQWQGIALYTRVQATPSWAVIPRFEWFDDRDGFATGLAQKVKELTFTSEQKLGGKLLTRIEYRRDFSDQPFFTKSGVSKKSQDNLTVGLVYAFSRSF
jgi:putative OmpL-like beta-barrel porin-2